jgi:hypothetical protein
MKKEMQYCIIPRRIGNLALASWNAVHSHDPAGCRKGLALKEEWN